MLRSIRWKLAGSLLLIVVVSVGLSSFLIGLGTQQEFKQYVANCDQMYTASVTSFLSDYYKANNGWKNVGLSQFVLITNSGQTIGRLYPLGCDCSGITSSIGRACSMNVSYTGAEQNFLSRTSNYLWMVGLLTAAVALFL